MLLWHGAAGLLGLSPGTATRLAARQLAVRASVDNSIPVVAGEHFCRQVALVPAVKADSTLRYGLPGSFRPGCAELSGQRCPALSAKEMCLQLDGERNC